MDKFNVLGLKIAIGDYNKVVDFVIKKAKQGEKLTVAPLSIHSIVLAVFDKEYKKTLDDFELLVPDSFWHLWGMNFLYKGKYQQRFYGPFFMRDIIKKAKKEDINTYLFGGKNKKTLNKLEEWFKNLGRGRGRIYTYKASFSIKEKELESLVKKVEKKGKGILFIGISTPLQHRLGVKVGNRLKIPVVTVGAAFNLLSGEERMAPGSWRNSGFEWLYRLKEDPFRLLGRYIFCLLFFPLVFLQKLRKSI
jgi:N-acetylglucosaminyldiphosphoundecaprenol N-acetyl-beta-D-mannosaminyltransferase